jgi:peptidoglycan/xylan/chitin deacetylase (PgdA/CDA1 family)
MPDRLKPLLGSLVACLIQYPLRLSGRRVGVALMYHGLADRTGDPQRELVPPHASSLFEAQLRHLRAHFRLVAARELLEAAQRRRRGGRFPVAVTFDDDLTSHVDVAMPILRRLGAPATFFLCGASFDGLHRFWWELMQSAIERGNGCSVRRIVDARGGRGTSAEPRTIRQLAATVEALPPPNQDEVSGELAPLAGPPSPRVGMRESQVTALAQAGFEIGFHTLRHYRLPPLDEEGLHRALREGRDRIASAADRQPALIAYPHGAGDERVAAASREAGYSLGFTSRPAAVGPGSEPLLLGRIEPSFESKGHLALQVVRCLLA